MPPTPPPPTPAQRAPTASIVVPTFRRPAMLVDCVSHLVASIAAAGRDDVEIVVTDGGRDGESARLLAERFPQVRHVENATVGAAANRNFGAAQARGGWLLFTDDDCLPSRAWVGAMLDAIDRGVGRVLEGPTVADRPARRLDEESPTNPTGGYLWSCNMAIEKALFDSVGGFCEEFPGAGSEDTDLRMRLAAIGVRPVFVPAAEICHPWRRARGLKFQFNIGRAYLILVRRHPYMLGRTPWWTLLANIARSLRSVLRAGAKVGFRGIGFAVGRVFVDAGFAAIAIARYGGAASRRR